MIRRAFLFIAVSALLIAPAAAQQHWIQQASGTGFFINRAGDLITNEHVVRRCQSIVVRTPGGDRAAQLSIADPSRDLAILKTQYAPPSIAPMRWNISDLKIGDTLYVYGFPGTEGAGGKPSFVQTTLSDMKGPSGQPQWLQLKAPSRQGNSGGPVLDATGNVIAVIKGRNETYRDDGHGNPTGPLLAESTTAITLSTLRDFLDRNLTGFYETPSGLVAYAEPVIAQNASKFIYPVICTQGTVIR